MAKKPTDKQVKKAQTETKQQEVKKVIAQNKLDKDFILTGAGVIPEKVWRKLK